MGKRMRARKRRRRRTIGHLRSGGGQRDDDASIATTRRSNQPLHMTGKRLRVENHERAAAREFERRTGPIGPPLEDVLLAARTIDHEQERALARRREMRDRSPRQRIATWTLQDDERLILLAEALRDREGHLRRGSIRADTRSIREKCRRCAVSIGTASELLSKLTNLVDRVSSIALHFECALARAVE